MLSQSYKPNVMSVFLEFPSIEDYPVYAISNERLQDQGVIAANAFNWLLTLEFSSLRSAEFRSFEAQPKDTDPGRQAYAI